ncbi:E3 ubiquitin-protein ligase ATL41-like [Phragmites australis]|uniref:E3 ubiquitin-protein ligase ATL41-like n=1 Tax=Phragmites australis TaxID=29695 RepID=UPI002D787A79|nr:E3 ubiquitin-protein ligase ATL41-like [Phragmites australis]
MHHTPNLRRNSGPCRAQYGQPMGADDNHRPHPKAQDPPIPLEDGPLHAHWDLIPQRPHVAGQQVTEPSSYVVAGKILLATAGMFSGVLLALIALHLYNSSRRRRLSGGRRRLLRSLAIAGAGDDSRDGGGAAASSPRGLEPAVLRALPVVTAGAGDGDCAVCLAELEPGEKARALPRCGHRFHVECIDAWFRGNATCPLCRADVEAPDPAAAAAVEAQAQPEVRIDVGGVDATAAAKASMAPAMGRLASGTNLDKTRRVFASTRSVSF